MTVSSASLVFKRRQGIRCSRSFRDRGGATLDVAHHGSPCSTKPVNAIAPMEFPRDLIEAQARALGLTLLTPARELGLNMNPFFIADAPWTCEPAGGRIGWCSATIDLVPHRGMGRGRACCEVPDMTSGTATLGAAPDDLENRCDAGDCHSGTFDRHGQTIFADG